MTFTALCAVIYFLGIILVKYVTRINVFVLKMYTITIAITKNIHCIFIKKISSYKF